MTYLDWAATTPPEPESIRILGEAALEFPGNPSQPHALGKAAKAALENARGRCAAFLGCSPGNLAFTSGGTEANSIAFLSKLPAREPGTVLIGGLEHPSVTEAALALKSLGWRIGEIRPGKDGIVSAGSLESELEKHPDVRLVALMAVNNEMGAVQPIRSLASAVRNRQEETGRAIHFHADMVQAPGKIPIDLSAVDVDTASFGAHKFRGPRGVGFFYHKAPRFEAFVKGGGQEHGVRPGTENVAGALAAADALERHGAPDGAMAGKSRRFLDGLGALPGVRFIPEGRADAPEDYVPGIIAVAFPPIPGEVLARVLADRGFAVSTGSACHNNKKGKIAKAARIPGIDPDVAAGMIRISFGPAVSDADIDAFLEALSETVGELGRAVRRG